MPRLSTGLLRKARAIDPLLPLLLRPCRDLRDAHNELRWLGEHVQDCSPSPQSRRHRLKKLCLDRSRGKPLQYILGNQPFGELDIQCRPGVLIPRPETESYTTFLALCLKEIAETRQQARLRILDLCTGTGCIALLLRFLLAKSLPDLYVRGVDISETALQLAQNNLELNIKHGKLNSGAISMVNFCHGDVLTDKLIGSEGWDVVVSNPPYVSETSFDRDTSASARRFEPRLALVPRVGQQSTRNGTDLTGDVFYEKIADIAQRAGARVVLMEVADDEQAQRVLTALIKNDAGGHWSRSAIWHDNLYNEDPQFLQSKAIGTGYQRIGDGNARAIVLMADGLNSPPSR